MSKLFGFKEARRYFLALLHKRYPFTRLAKESLQINITIRVLTDKNHIYEGDIFHNKQFLRQMRATPQQIANYIYLNQLPEKESIND